MQFILTQQERDALVDAEQLNKANGAIAALRRMVVPLGQCVHDNNGPEYCDACPLSSIGGDWKGETRPPYELSRTMCWLPRSYSK